MHFTQKLQHAVQSSGSTLCVGLDPVPQKIPLPLKERFNDDSSLILTFCKQVIEATKTVCCAYKPNMAFFEALGSKGWEVLEQVIDSIPSGKIIIADAKRGDIGSTAEQYRKAFFEQLNVDAITLNPLMGIDTIEPFLGDASKAVFVLAITSNSGSADFLQRRFEGRLSLAAYIAEHLAKIQKNHSTHIGLVAGATHPEEIRDVVQEMPEATLLIPGIGSQGGSIQDLADVLKHHTGIPLVSSSRSILYAGRDEENWLDLVAQKADETHNQLKALYHEPQA